MDSPEKPAEIEQEGKSKLYVRRGSVSTCLSDKITVFVGWVERYFEKGDVESVALER